MHANQKVGRLTLLEPDQRRQRAWLCRCDCGTVKTVLQNNLEQRLTQSCGCLRREVKRLMMARAFPEVRA